VVKATYVLRLSSSLWCLLCCLLLAACQDDAPPPTAPNGRTVTGDPSGSPSEAVPGASVDAPVPLETFAPEPPPDPAQLGLSVASDGRTFVIESAGDIELRYDPAPTPSPMTALARCTDWLMQCFDRVQQGMDACFGAVPPCGGERPWEEALACCPEACATHYGERRAEGREPLQAFLDVFGPSVRCIPEYDRWLAEGRP